MPRGCFLIELDPKSKPTVRAEYFPDESTRLTPDNGLILKLRLGLSEKKRYTHLTSEYTIVSYRIVQKRKKDLYTLITCVVLDPGEDAKHYFDAVKMFAEELADKASENDEELKKYMTEFYDRYFGRPSAVINKEELVSSLKERVKKLTRDGKFDEAKKLLDLIKKIPDKLFSALETAEKAVKKSDFERAEREYRKAIKFAEEIGDAGVIRSIEEKISFMRRIPKLEEKREKALKAAREALKNEDFGKAYKFFMEAAALSKELLDPIGTEEYSLKAEALAKFAEVHGRFAKLRKKMKNREG